MIVLKNGAEECMPRVMFNGRRVPDVAHSATSNEEDDHVSSIALAKQSDEPAGDLMRQCNARHVCEHG